MKKILLLTILILSFTLTQAQKSKTDSLRRVLQTQKQDTNRVKTLLSLAYLYTAVPDTSLQFGMKALELSTSLNYKEGINHSLSLMTIAYAFSGNFPQALNCTFKALKINEAEHNTAAIAGTYNLLGTLYREQGNYGEALNYLSKGLTIAKRGDLFLNISETFSKMHVLDSASMYARKGLYMATKSGDANSMQWAYGRMASSYQDEGKYKLARTYYDSSLSTNLTHNLSPWLAYLGLASLYEKTEQLDSSLYYARLCLAKVSQTGLYNAKKKVIPIFTSVFEKMHNTDSALFYMKLEKAVNDSMFSQQKLSQLQSLAFNEKMQEKETEEAVQKAKEKWCNQVIIFSLLVGLLIFGAIAFIFYRNNKQKQKANKLLQQQKEEIGNKNKELEIESALEKVRYRSLAMRQSDELKDVVKVVFEQLQHLGISFDFASIDLFTDGSKDLYSYTYGSTGNEFFVSGRYTPYFDHPIMNDIVDARERDIEFHVKTYTKEEINSALQYAFEHTEVQLEDSVKAQMRLNAGYTIAGAFGNNCSVNINNWSAKAISDSEKTILVRFAKAFEQPYLRFLDLQQAEEHAREAQIEAALERVRSRAMAMQKSEELREIIQVILDQLCGLDFKIESASFAVEINETNDFRGWLAAPGYQYASRIDVPYLDHPVFDRIVEAKEKGETFYTLLLTKEEKDRFFDHYFKFAPIPEERKHDIYNSKGWALSVVLMKTIALSITNYVPLPYSDQQNKTLVRFVKAFEQVYTRFLDLQKAEASAREAQIEAALERVRSRSLAMHHSNELQPVVRVMYEQLTKLGFNKDENDVVSINLFDDDTGDMLSWATGSDGAVPFCLTTPKNDYAIYTNIWEARANGEDFFSKVYSREEKNAYWSYLFAQNNYAQIPQDSKDFVMQGEGYAYDIAIAKHACIMYPNFHGRLTLNDEQKEILKRFVKVFEQAYIRFLDLQKAEASSKEAQIEAALERVRSRSMGMQKSEELSEVIQLILDQLLGLNFNIDSASFIVEVNERNDIRTWIAAPGQQYANKIYLPYINHPAFNKLLEAREAKIKGESLLTYTLSKEEKDHFFDYFIDHVPGVPDERKQFWYNSAGWANSSVLLKSLSLNIQNYSGIPYSEEENKTLVRFGKAFEQTYTRFLDLQKVEAQAREAQIEAALERVRSRSMGMQKSEELREVIQVIFDQLYGLHFNLDTASFAVEIDKTNDLRNWVASPLSQYATRIDVPYIDHPVFNRVVEAKQKGEDFIIIQLDKEEKDRFFDHYFKFAFTTDERKSYVYKSKSWVQSAVVMRNLMLTMANYSGIPFTDEENKTLVRFGKAFEQTYTRFLDLQKAEAAAKEAVKQASIDRVRAEIASMRTTTDLEKITPLIWNELKNLQVPFIRCGVFIMDKEKEQIHVYLATPDGKAIASFQLPYNSKGISQQVISNWQNNQPFIDHWNSDTFSQWTKSLVEEGAIKADEKYTAEKPPETLYLHFLPFLQGMLYVGNGAQLKEDEMQLVQSLANSFATAYARYEDFNKLETAKQQVDIALKELRSTQQQLIQSEKMASLGELTAGIAHEIQNPLNFVNNFSDVNKELIAEMKEEIDKGNIEEVKAIANDIEENEVKINHHGKRADAIVKGMLQHSRTNSGKKELTDINLLVDEYLRLSYHGLRAKDKMFNSNFITDFDESMGSREVIPQDIGRVLLNLFNNAFYSVNEKKKQLNGIFQPAVLVSTRKSEDTFEIRVKDNGNGIPEKVIDKIFQPFFTTKPTGQGTGLGLSLSYDIIKAHGGELRVETVKSEGAEFIILLPLK